MRTGDNDLNVSAIFLSRRAAFFLFSMPGLYIELPLM